MKKIILILAIFLTVPAFAAKIQRDGVKNLSDCLAAGSTGVACLLGSDMLWDTGNDQLLSKTISAGEYNAGNSGTALTVNFQNGISQKIVLTGNVTLTLSNPLPGIFYSLRLVQDGTGSRTVTWPSSVKWSGGTAPTLTSLANKTDMIMLYYSPGVGNGNTYLGSALLNFTE